MVSDTVAQSPQRPERGPRKVSPGRVAPTPSTVSTSLPPTDRNGIAGDPIVTGRTLDPTGPQTCREDQAQMPFSE